MPDDIEELYARVFDGEVRTLGCLWETLGWENAASYAREIPGLKLQGMEEFPEPEGQVDLEVAILETELAILVRKMWAKNLYAEGRIESIIRGLKYAEMAALPPPCERH